MFVSIEIRGVSRKLDPKENCGRAGDARTSSEVHSYLYVKNIHVYCIALCYKSKIPLLVE